jgi:serine/threonine protein phosphatase PrpC
MEAGVLDGDQAIHHEDRHLVSNVVGAADMRIEMGPIVRLRARDTVLLATDGLFDNLYQPEIITGIRCGRLDRAAAALATAARARMTDPEVEAPSKPDDLTFVIFRPARSGRITDGR